MRGTGQYLELKGGNERNWRIFGTKGSTDRGPENIWN
jgi:hypothetical protein